MNAIEKSERIISGLLKHDSEDPCVHTFEQILDSIFDNKSKTSGVFHQPRSQTPDAIPHKDQQGEIV